jgi:hypothetical protein
MGALLVLQRHVASTIFWRLLGAEWARCDSITKHRSALRKLFAQRLEAGGFPIFEAMSASDRRVYDALPDRVVLYRGCHRSNRMGFSWTTARDVAASVPFLRRYRGGGEPMLLSAVAHKSNIAFVSTARWKPEIVVLPCHRRIMGCEMLTQAVAA